MAREVITGRQVSNAYSIEGVHDSLSTSLGSQRVSLEDDLEPSSDSEARVRTRVRIMVNGRDYGSTVEAVARPHFHDANRYHGYVSLKRLEERRTGAKRILVAQALGPPPGARGGYDEDRMRYRVLTVSADGTVADDVFSYPERGKPALRTWAIDGVVPHPIGYQSDLMQTWPTLWYPILYPWLSGLVGALMLIQYCLRRGRGIQHGV